MIADFQGNLLDFPAIDGGSGCGAPTMKALVEGRLRDDGRLTDGESPIELTGCMPRMTCCDLTGDGHQDLISILEDGHVYVSVNDGRHLSQPRLLQQERSIIKTGVLAVPAAVRNRAGKVDLYCGNASGHIMHLRNITDDAEPDLEPPRLLRSGGETFRVIAGPDGSPQGPVEYKWGYVAPTALDWTGDGVPDLLMGCITGAYWLLLGSKTDADLEWAEPRRITVDGQPFVGVWRVRPSVADWNADGQPEMLTLDEQGFLSLYGQQRAGSPEDLRSVGTCVEPKRRSVSHHWQEWVRRSHFDWTSEAPGVRLGRRRPPRVAGRHTLSDEETTRYGCVVRRPGRITRKRNADAD